ncbi:hypothetical protein CONCODRAFT_8740 [Conidiobolus coronatus NRRL 28638]|uniref:Uncharacterized protein n=1 Tax=Conidiobolus coronatus (strain ATCC 28846 / CBS 209.66 / NRRL 28638) TaxID=796925 RepID=A0A137P1J0_CONC2|nr:hypothetical protein CONCODRAFT_8740 [Conidiobolus coronatus NRRL 28638]|eukprot:KXN68935.1 hypothetical protein CONCODRAFT_8740 [Conidiobolus coronatus NRRL 28638]
MVAQVYELADSYNGLSFSPYVILAQLFLLHKGIKFEGIPLTFSQVGPTINRLLPTVKFDNGDIIYDSLEIAKYLDSKYEQNPILSSTDPKVTQLVNEYLSINNLNHFKLIILEINANYDEINQKRWREVREKILGQKMEEFAGNQELAVKEYIQNIGDLAKVLETRDFLDGEKPAINDYTIISNVQNLKTIAPEVYKKVIENHPNPALLKWVNRVSDLFDGYLKNRKTL